MKWSTGFQAPLVPNGLENMLNYQPPGHVILIIGCLICGPVSGMCFSLKLKHIPDAGPQMEQASITWPFSLKLKHRFIYRAGIDYVTWSSFSLKLKHRFIYRAGIDYMTQSSNPSVWNWNTGSYIEQALITWPGLGQFNQRERERLSLSAFLRTEDIRVHIVHISHLIITYILE